MIQARPLREDRVGQHHASIALQRGGHGRADPGIVVNQKDYFIVCVRHREAD